MYLLFFRKYLWFPKIYRWFGRIYLLFWQIYLVFCREPFWISQNYRVFLPHTPISDLPFPNPLRFPEYNKVIYVAMSGAQA